MAIVNTIRISTIKEALVEAMNVNMDQMEESLEADGAKKFAGWFTTILSDLLTNPENLEHCVAEDDREVSNQINEIWETLEAIPYRFGDLMEGALNDLQDAGLEFVERPNPELN